MSCKPFCVCIVEPHCSRREARALETQACHQMPFCLLCLWTPFGYICLSVAVTCLLVRRQQLSYSFPAILSGWLCFSFSFSFNICTENHSMWYISWLNKSFINLERDIEFQQRINKQPDGSQLLEEHFCADHTQKVPSSLLFMLLPWKHRSRRENENLWTAKLKNYMRNQA